MKRYNSISTFLLAAVFLTACGDEPQTAAKLLSRVPADTPYLIASGEPVPEALGKRMRSVLQPMMEDMNAGFGNLVQTLEKTDPEAAERMQAVMAELMPVFRSEEGLKQAGLSREDNFVVYGHRLMPVVRIAPSKPEVFEDWVHSVFEAAKFTPESVQHQGVDAWRVALGPTRLVAGMDDGVYSVALTLPSRLDATLEHLFNGDAIDKSMAEGGKLTAVRDHYGLLPNMTGYLDFVRITELLLGEGQNSKSLIVELGGEAPALTPACKAEMIGFAGRAPRAVWGYQEFGEDYMEGTAVLELAPALAAELQSWTVPIPGLGTDSEALLQFGLSLKALTAAESIRGWLSSLAQREFACAKLAEIPWTMAAGQINTGPLYMVGNPHGLVFQLYDLKVDMQSMQDSKVNANVVFAMENPRSVKALLANVLPQLQSLQIPADGNPVPLPGDLAPQFDKPAFVAMTDHLLGVSVGVESDQRLATAMSADVVEHAPFMQFQFDAQWLYSSLAEVIPKSPAPTAASEEERLRIEAANRRTAELMRAYAEIYDRMAVRVMFTENGIEMPSRVTFQ